MKGICERLREKEGTLTAQKMAIDEFLTKSKEHPTADEMH
jgi:Fe2+ or Zn2+ uptake regulation protein